MSVVSDKLQGDMDKTKDIRAGSVCLNSFGRFAKWISATDYAAAIIGVSALK